MIKPDIRIYELLLERYGLNYEDLIFIDDRKDNIEAAKTLGITGIHYTSPEKLRQGLNKLGCL